MATLSQVFSIAFLHFRTARKTEEMYGLLNVQNQEHKKISALRSKQIAVNA